MTNDITTRYTAAQSIARAAGALGLKYFNSFDTLTIEILFDIQYSIIRIMHHRRNQGRIRFAFGQHLM